MAKTRLGPDGTSSARGHFFDHHAAMSFLPRARQFTRAEFAKFLAGPDVATWKPTGVTLHGTSSPSLSMRSGGFTAENMVNLRHYYETADPKTGKGVWRSGPHFFVDDQEDGIWLFCDLSAPGTHSPSFNSTDWGIEVLGEYDKADDPTTGRGLKAWQNAAWLAAQLMAKIGPKAKLHLHRDDPRTTHKNCPGKLIRREWIVELIATEGNYPAGGTALPPKTPAKTAAEEPVIRRGSTGVWVSIAQTNLKIKADGDFGPVTEQAVRAFQASHGLVADGVIGPKTWDVLLSEGGK